MRLSRKAKSSIVALLLLLFLFLCSPVGAQTYYWENPRALIPAAARFPAAVSGGGLVAVVWQVVEADPQGGGQIYLSIQTSRDVRSWQRNDRFLGPISFEEQEVQLYSAAMDRNGMIYLAVAAGENRTELYRSTDQGKSFTLLSTIDAGTASLAPNIFLTGGGNLLLFVAQERGNFLFISYSVSRNGRDWSDFQPLVEGSQLPFNVLPSHTSLNGREYVVFQAWPSGAGDERNYQLYLVSSADGGYTWSSASRLRLSENIAGEELSAETYSNQRPNLETQDGSLVLAWERQRGVGVTQICFATILPDGTVEEAETVTEGEGAAHFPRIIRNRGRILLFWFDSRRGDNHIFFAYKRGALWQEKDLSDIDGSSLFPYPVELNEQLFVFWENRAGENSRVMFLQPDQTVTTPSVTPLNFDPGKPSRQNTVQVRWTVPRDPSGIAGVEYLWTQDRDAPLERELRALSDTTSVQLTADEDGPWYFRLSAQDYAGNWSEPVSVMFTRDTQPPEKPVIQPPETDEEGYLSSNTFVIRWQQPSAAADLSGYSYSMIYLGSADQEDVDIEPSLPPRPLTASPVPLAYNNLDNGLWAFAVASVDEAGNASEPDKLLMRLNKYIPVTFISSVNARRDPFGVISVSIGGRGFTEGGTVESVILDQDGRPPYDYVYPSGQGLFEVVSDRLIRGLSIVDIEEGLYAVGVEHPSRGIAFTAPTLFLESPGTVKFGDFSFEYRRYWRSMRRFSYTLSSGNLILYLVMAFLALLFVVSIRKLAGVIQEGRMLQAEVLDVVRGKVSIFEREMFMKKAERRRVSLLWKFTMLIMIIVLITVLMVSIPLGFFMINRQKGNLTQALRQRVDVLTGSVARSAENFLLEQDEFRLDVLTDQIEGIEEFQYLTITGQGIDDPGNFGYVWASNDPDIDSKLQGGTFGLDSAGTVRVQDGVSPVIEELADQVNMQARQRVGDLLAEISALQAESREQNLFQRSRTDPAAAERYEEIGQEIEDRNQQIFSELQNIGSVTGSVPPFDPQDLLPFYTFYRPIVYAVPGQDVYFRGTVRIGVSTERIQNELDASTRDLIIRTGLIALIAAGLGFLGAFLMASIIRNPIRKLEDHVVTIRDTEDKEDLRDHVLQIRTRDEIGTLAAEINQMTQSLVKAEIARKDLTVGKGVQKMFIPLEPDPTDPQGGKGAIGREQDESIEIFGYYEGAKGVSGDYFDFRKLTDNYYAVIKCDVAGKGVPAALIMVQVATIFSSHFRTWTPKSKVDEISALADSINDMLEERGFKGRFAALTLSIIDSKSGKCYFVNAGDKDLHIYRASLGRMVKIELPDAPAAGVFAKELVDMKGGFQLVAQQLQAGDTVFLFTDGIEEAKRTFRNERFETVICDEPGLEDNAEHGGTHLKGADNEQLGQIRIYDIINAVFNRQSFRLVKFHNPIPEEDLLFDFTGCQGTVEEAVLAMVSVEKVFRLNPDPSATAEDHVEVDRNIDAFLKKHFKQYNRYFQRIVTSEEDRSYVTYSGLKEDDQYDDLTILAIRKK
jgi:serine phosphatase RsbU (regulator of sigma subunit)